MSTVSNEGLGPSRCSSEFFTYDEVVACIRRKKAIFLKKLHRLDSDSLDELRVMSAYIYACDFMVQEFAKLSIEKQSERLKLGPSGAIPETM